MFSPLFSIICEELFDGCFDFGGSGGKSSGLVSFEEFDIPFFLARDDLMNEHGALRCDGFMDGSSACFSND